MRGKKRSLVGTNCVMFANGETAFFTNGPTVRGAKHLMDLSEAIGEGYEGWIAFICQRGDTWFLSANESADPHFAETLRMGHGLGVKVFAFNCEVTKRGITRKDRIGVIV